MSINNVAYLDLAARASQKVFKFGILLGLASLIPQKIVVTSTHRSIARACPFIPDYQQKILAILNIFIFPVEEKHFTAGI